MKINTVLFLISILLLIGCTLIVMNTADFRLKFFSFMISGGLLIFLYSLSLFLPYQKYIVNARSENKELLKENNKG